MLKITMPPLGCGLLVMALSGCGGDTSPQDTLPQVTPDAGALCESLVGRRYMTQSLGDGGLTPNGIWLMHWSASFETDQVQFMQSDVGLIADYQCQSRDDGKLEVVLTSNAIGQDTFTFTASEDDPLHSFSLSPLGGDNKHYVAATAADGQDTCALVKGRRYAEALPHSDVIAVEVPFIEFGQGQNVRFELTASGQAAQAGIYDCDTGALHIHSQSDAPADITVAPAQPDGSALNVYYGDQTITLTAQGDACPSEPYCTVNRQPIQCVTTPCPVGVYETVAVSVCREELPLPPDYLFQGECGDKEGEPYFEQGDCNDGEEVCAAAPAIQPCENLPCPVYRLQTFANECIARDAGAFAVKEQDCGNEEGESVDPLPIGCAAVASDPVCAKAHENIACVTEPCPQFGYQTFPSECDAQAQLAAVAFAGACETLEGELTTGEPPVRMQLGLPEVEKTVTVVDARIHEDILEVELGYSGCNPQHFDLVISTAFTRSRPPQASHAFVPQVNDACLAYFTTVYRYDLRPLKRVHKHLYPESEGVVILPELATYRF